MRKCEACDSSMGRRVREVKGVTDSTGRYKAYLCPSCIWEFTHRLDCYTKDIGIEEMHKEREKHEVPEPKQWLPELISLWQRVKNLAALSHVQVTTCYACGEIVLSKQFPVTMARHLTTKGWLFENFWYDNPVIDDDLDMPANYYQRSAWMDLWRSGKTKCYCPDCGKELLRHLVRKVELVEKCHDKKQRHLNGAVENLYRDIQRNSR